MFQIVRKIDVWFTVTAIRVGWYKYRRELGYPITLQRALFSPMPRFGSFNEGEDGCPAYDRINYAMARPKKDTCNV
jgi:hypothetical protein